MNSGQRPVQNNAYGNPSSLNRFYILSLSTINPSGSFRSVEGSPYSAGTNNFTPTAFAASASDSAISVGWLKADARTSIWWGAKLVISVLTEV